MSAAAMGVLWGQLFSPVGGGISYAADNFGLFITHLYGTEPKDVLIENNVFERTFQANGQKAPYAMMVADCFISSA